MGGKSGKGGGGGARIGSGIKPQPMKSTVVLIRAWDAASFINPPRLNISMNIFSTVFPMHCQQECFFFKIKNFLFIDHVLTPCDLIMRHDPAEKV